MKHLLYILLTLFFVSCGNEKVLQLPEINHSEITEINDVSAAYLFYDETQKDSVELNRKNLISTTNWLVNVDKRLTLKQVIPHIKFLQDKKANSSHKNKNAKNYFTCNDISKKNLGFIEFTDVIYQNDLNTFFKINFSKKTPKWDILTQIISSDSIRIHFATDKFENDASTQFSNKKNLLNDISDIIFNDTIHSMQNRDINLFSMFNPSLSFQDYISIKSKLSSLNLEKVTISKNEFISN